MAWNRSRAKVPTMSQRVFGNDTPSQEVYVAKVQEAYNTPIFTAIRRFQEVEGGRNPAFIASVLNIGIGDALSLSHVLWESQP